MIQPDQRTTALSLICIVLTALGIGCSAGDTGRGADVDFRAAPELQLEMSLRLGSRDDPSAGFSRVGRLQLDSSGRLYVMEVLDREIRVYDEAGALERTIGGTGQGPGEFQTLDDFGVLGDVIWARDIVGRRNTVFNLAGEVLQTVPATGVEVATDVPELRVRVYPAALTSGGLWSGSMTTARVGPPPDSVIEVPKLLFDSAGEVVDTAGSWQLRPTTIRVSGMELEPVRAPPSEPIEEQAGEDLVIVDRTPAHAVEEAVFTVMRVTADRDTVWLTRVRYPPREVPSSHVDSLVEERVERAAAAGLSASLARRALRDDLSIAPFYPPVTEMRIGPDGSVWLHVPDESDSQSWLVLDADGAARGRVMLPPSTRRVHVVTNDFVWTEESDEYDVPFLVKHRIR